MKVSYIDKVIHLKISINLLKNKEKQKKYELYTGLSTECE